MKLVTRVIKGPAQPLVCECGVKLITLAEDDDEIVIGCPECCDEYLKDTEIKWAKPPPGPPTNWLPLYDAENGWTASDEDDE